MSIHPTAVIDPGAELASGVSVGPYAVIESGVRIGEGSRIGAHCVLSGSTIIGKNNKIGPFVHLGGAPQDLKYHGEDTRVVIGDNNDIREYVSIHRGTITGHGVTTVGNGNMLMAYCHVAHDCIVGDSVIMANAATLGGHVEIGDRVTIGGLTGVHQFARIGAFAYIGGLSGISKDVPPYVILSGVRNQMRVTGINKIGLKRNGFEADCIKKLEQAFKILFRSPGVILQDGLRKVNDELADCEPVQQLVTFIESSKRGIVRIWEDE